MKVNLKEIFKKENLNYFVVFFNLIYLIVLFYYNQILSKYTLIILLKEHMKSIFILFIFGLLFCIIHSYFVVINGLILKERFFSNQFYNTEKEIKPLQLILSLIMIVINIILLTNPVLRTLIIFFILTYLKFSNTIIQD